MSYDHTLGKTYDQVGRLMQIVSERGSALSKTLTDDSMDASSEMLDVHCWSPEGLRFSLKCWDWDAKKWEHHRYSRVMLSPAEVETILSNESIRSYAVLKETIDAEHLRQNITRFSTEFERFPDDMKQRLADYIENSGEGAGWAIAIESVVSRWKAGN